MSEHNINNINVSNVQAQEILRLLEKTYPQAKTALHYNSTFELLLAVILSAQTTDRQVNEITARLFPHIKGDPRAVLAMGEERLGKAIQSCGLFRQKSRQIMETCRLLVEHYGGEIPRTREELMQLPGCGRKTANIMLSVAFGVPALAVDTHVLRVSRRLGLTTGKDARHVEDELCNIIPTPLWAETHHRLIAHGRKVCSARNPGCDVCSLAYQCRYYKNNIKNSGVRIKESE